jgi:hypothetical protein
MHTPPNHALQRIRPSYPCCHPRLPSTLRSSFATPVLRSSSATEDGEDGQTGAHGLGVSHPAS